MIATKENIDRLMAVVTAEERVDLLLAWNGNTTAMQEYKNTPGSRSRADMASAREYLQEVADRLADRYFPDEAESRTELADRFVNRKQALNWLQAQGYKVGQDKFYKDCKAGCPRVHRDKSVSKFEVLQYGQQLDVALRTGGLGAGESVSLALVMEEEARDKARITKAMAIKAEKQNEEYLKGLDKKWTLRDDALREIACLIGGIQNAFFLTVHKRTSEIILKSGGKQERFADVCEYLEEHLVKEAFNTASIVGCDLIFQVDEGEGQAE
jgi:hypothetical protein